MLKDKVVVITGGAGLLGQSFVKVVLENNGIAIIADSNKERGCEVAGNLQKHFPEKKVEFHFLDINNKQSIIELIDYLFIKYGTINALVNNAYPRNKNYGRKFEDVTYEDFCENININLGGYFLTTQQFLHFFCKQGFGNIINISSIYGVMAPRFEIYDNTLMTMPVEYAVVKSGLLHLTRYLAKYYKGKKIKVNAISLGGIKDAQPESFIIAYNSNCLDKGMLLPKDITGTLLFLLSDQSEFVNGQNIIVDDGFTL
ncbi:MAG: SDR family oxidoreductase [Bacteroidales bacterium]|nr:SDR family oxidoreductase [Bacteroidales bacterium]